LSQLVIRLPRALPGGTRPVATPPATAPRKKGVSTEDAAKLAPKTRLSHIASTTLGMIMVDITAANTGGNPVQSTTRAKISQTWLASHTGPIECSISSRWAQPRRAPPANRSQNPAPKSAPPSRA
jgi:hypothetical protein